MKAPTAFALALAALLPWTSPLQADQVPFTYSWETTPVPPLFPSGTGSVILSIPADRGGVSTTGSATADDPDR